MEVTDVATMKKKYIDRSTENIQAKIQDLLHNLFGDNASDAPDINQLMADLVPNCDPVAIIEALMLHIKDAALQYRKSHKLSMFKKIEGLQKQMEIMLEQGHLLIHRDKLYRITELQNWSFCL